MVECMSPSWKTHINVCFALILLALGVWMAWDDATYPGDIVFQSSLAPLFISLVTGAWLLLALLLAIFPKRYLFPILVLSTCRMSLGYPLSHITDSKTACIIVSIGVAVLAAVYLAMVLISRKHTAERPWFRVGHTIAAVAFFLLLGIASIPLGIGGLVKGAKSLLGDYTQFSMKAISMVERGFQKDGKTVYLIGMMHIGDQKFYKAIDYRIQSEVSGTRVVLTEGVSDEKGILPKSFASGGTYKKWAERFGLKMQDAERHEMSKAERKAQMEEWQSRGVEMINADIDVSELSPDHQEQLVEILSALDTDNIAELLKGPDITGEELEYLMKDGLIGQRNDHLMEHIDAAMKRSEVGEILVPWGAAHLPDIEKRLLSQGFEKITEEIRPVVRFWKGK